MDQSQINRVAVVHFLVFLLGAFMIYELGSAMSEDKVNATKRAIASSKYRSSIH